MDRILLIGSPGSGKTTLSINTAPDKSMIYIRNNREYRKFLLTLQD